jgi:hypothetical protein
MLDSRFRADELQRHNIDQNFGGSGLVKVFLILCVAATSLVAQSASSDNSGYNTRSITAVSQFFDHDFVNVFVFANGVWDSRVPVLSSNTTTFGSGLGWEAGGGLSLSHQFKGGSVTLNYRGSYRDYRSVSFSGGNQQSLALGVSKQLNRRWTVGLDASGGIMSYGTSYYSPSSVATSVGSNPFSVETRFLSTGVNLTYQQTRRLSYVFNGDYFLTNYSYANAFSSRGFSGGASALYRITARTTVGASYSHSYYTYSKQGGTSNIDGAFLTLSHQFPEHWQIDLSGGVNRSHSQGTITIPVSAIFKGQLVTGYYTGAYDRTVYSPAFQAVLTRLYRHSSFSAAGGQSVLGGNGVFLTSRNLFANSTYSYSTRRTNLSFGVSYSRLSSLANSVAQTYSYDGASASYGVNLVRYVSANFRYDFLHYDGLFSYNGINEHRVSFGLSLSSKSVPLTLF